MDPFNPNITIETDRLILRTLKESDAGDIFVNINHDKDVLKYFIDRYVDCLEEMNLGRTIEYCRQAKRYLLAIELKSSHKAVGIILQCSTQDHIFNSTEIGFAIGKAYWNQGYTSEAVKSFIRFLFSKGIHKVFASHIIGNDASGKVMKKCGMTYEGRRIHELYYHDQCHDVDCYYILNPNS